MPGLTLTANSQQPTINCQLQTVNSQQLIRQQSSGGVVYTPSDYGLGSDISYEELDRFLHEKEDNVDNIISF